MATTTAKRRSARKSSRSPRAGAPRVRRERRREVLGLMLMAIALLTALALVSHTSADHAIARSFTLERALDPGDNQAHNLLGLVGATIAYWMVPRFVGFFSLILTGVMFAWGYTSFRRKQVVYLPVISGLAVVTTLLLAASIGWAGYAWDADLTLWSGSWGQAMAGWLTRVFGTVGAGGLLLLMLAVTALLTFDHDIQRSVDRAEGMAVALGANVRSRLADWRAEQQAAREQRRIEKSREEEKPEQSASTERKLSPPARPATPTGARVTINDHFRSAGAMDEGGRADARPAPPPPVPREPARDLGPDGPGRTGPIEVRVQEQVEEKRADPTRRHEPVPSAALPYHFPPISLLEEADHNRARVDYDEIEENNQILLDKLATYNIEITNINAIVGPTVTLYELTPAPGVKISRITALENDLAMAMAARGIRMIAPIPGKSAVGVEIPNRHRELVRVRDIIGTARFQDSKMELPVAIGKAIDGEVFVEDLSKMPHLLIAGATGSGKSVGLNTLIVGLLYACHPRDLKFVMIDPKKIELQQYSHIIDHYVAMPPHSEDPIITDFSEALGVLKSCEKEMEQRYDLLSDAGVRSIRDYNKRVDGGRLDAAAGHRHLPYIVVIVDELADLMMTAGKDIEGPIARLAQMARAVGIHLVLATQRPSVDVITGLIKANFPSRIAYQVASKVDSRTILDQNGAEGLVGNGDLLYMNGSHVVRLQGPFVAVEEVEEVTRFIGDQDGAGPYMLPSIEESTTTDREADVLEEKDELFDEAARIIVRSQQGSVSLLQRKLSVGYTRAARIVDQLEDAGVVGPFEGSKARRVLFESEIELDAFLESRKS